MQIIPGKKKLPFQNTKYPVSFAFTCGGIDYYQFADPLNTPYKRGFGAINFYRHMTMRCTEEYLNKHTKAVDKILSNPNAINVGQLAVLNEQMKERLSLVFEPETSYNFASVVFFDKTEDPTVYDNDYCEKKIAHWKKHAIVSDFFLQTPVLQWMPFLKNFDGDLNTYSRTVEAVNKLHSDRLHKVLLIMKSKTENAKNSMSSAGFRQTSTANG